MASEIEYETVEGEEDIDVEEGQSHGEVETVRFRVSSHGWDSDVEGLVKRMNRGDIHVPKFQRKFVWSGPEKSRFVESLILGLPVPTIFLAKDADSGTLNIVDGQQRLKTLQGYLRGDFALTGKQIEEDLRGRYYSEDVAKSKRQKVLGEQDLRSLSDAIIRAIVVTPDPAFDDEELGTEYNKAVIQIFKRLNTSGKPLQAQEVRACVMHGSLNESLNEMNDDDDWRKLFGNIHSRLKDIEAILRFVALLENGEKYSSPMPRFLDEFMMDNRHMEKDDLQEIEHLFGMATQCVVKCKGEGFFKRGGTFLLSRFDAIVVRLAELCRNGAELDPKKIEPQIDALLDDKDYKWSIEEFVNDKNRVEMRLARAKALITG